MFIVSPRLCLLLLCLCKPIKGTHVAMPIIYRGMALLFTKSHIRSQNLTNYHKSGKFCCKLVVDSSPIEMKTMHTIKANVAEGSY